MRAVGSSSVPEERGPTVLEVEAVHAEGAGSTWDRLQTSESAQLEAALEESRLAVVAAEEAACTAEAQQEELKAEVDRERAATAAQEAKEGANP